MCYNIKRDAAFLPGLPEGGKAMILGIGTDLCAVERTHICGGCEFKKPISCRLYPIRVLTFSDGTKALNLHHWNLCKDAFEKGRKEGIKVFQFLKDPLTEAFGPDFYAKLVAADALLQEFQSSSDRQG